MFGQRVEVKMVPIWSSHGNICSCYNEVSKIGNLQMDHGHLCEIVYTHGGLLEIANHTVKLKQEIFSFRPTHERIVL